METKKEEENNECQIIAAIDFGTSYTGCAYSVRGQDEDIEVSEWDMSMLSERINKTTTSILFSPNQAFHSFGSESEDKYADLLSEGGYEKWFFFKHFKMLLNDEGLAKRERQTWILNDESGKEMNAKYVFAHAFRYLKDYILSNIQNRYNLPETKFGDVKWLVTVPAIWSDVAKKFMRESACEAGIPSENLVLVYEPEAAAIWCMHKKEYLVHENRTFQKKLLTPGDRFILLDIGGGTVDIAVQEILHGDKIKLLHYPVGGDKGGVYVDERFKELFHQSLVQTEELSKKKELKVMRTFEIEKRKIHHLGPADFKISIPKKIKLKKTSGVEIKDNKMLIQENTVHNFFQPLLECIDSKLDEILKAKECMNITLMFVVGGCAESILIQKALRNKYRQFQVVVPFHPGLAVVRGAILFGQHTDTVTSRICRCTYGFAVFKEFRQGVHREEKRMERNGKIVAKDCFKKVFEIGETVRVDEYRKIDICDSFKTEIRKQKIHEPITVTIYSSTEKNPVYTDENCQRLGDIKMDPPPDGWPEEVKGHVTFFVSQTELVGTLYNSSGQFQDRCHFNFLV